MSAGAKPSKKKYSRVSFSQSTTSQQSRTSNIGNNRHSRTSSVTKKRLTVSVEVLNPYQVFKKEINKKCCYLEYLCCGAWNCCCCKRYCSCLCIWFTEYELVEKIGKTVSKQLDEKGITNTMTMKPQTLNSFEIEIRGISAGTQMAGKLVMGKLIKDKLKGKGVKANVNCERREVQVQIETETTNLPLIQDEK
mmetsp:Transcript_24946/g.21823  ORF Transcript_24946/g.21823 Transcript_24946/m.21823 type:complete len:193 (-) Transcript_24946:90-668(-)